MSFQNRVEVLKPGDMRNQLNDLLEQAQGEAMIAFLRWFTKEMSHKDILSTWRFRWKGSIGLFIFTTLAEFLLLKSAGVLEFMSFHLMSQGCWWTTLILLFWLPHRELISANRGK